jgi:hypothetical protein
LDPDLIGSLDLNWIYESGTKKAKLIHTLKSYKITCFSMLDVLFGGLEGKRMTHPKNSKKLRHLMF